jgi:iron complex outermembrane receptor protein
VLDATTPGHEERGLETLTSDIETNMLTVGVEGKIGAFDYSIATNDWTSTDRQTHHGLSRAGILTQLARSDGLALNVFGNAAATAEELAPARATFHRELTHFTRSTTGIVRFEPASLPAGPMRVAAGFEHRSGGLDSQPDDALSRDADAISAPFLNDPPVKADRRVNAYFAEVDLPILGSRRDVFAERSLDLTLAARRESFSDFGDATVKRATLRYQPSASDGLALRASYSESFYAPELRDIQAMGDANIGLVSDPLIRGSDGQPMTYLTANITGGNPDLNPTLGKYKNLGAILKPGAIPGLRFIVDIWRLDQTDAFVYPTVQAVVDGAAPGTVSRSPVALPGEATGRIVNVINRAANAAQRTVEGIDLGISYQRDFGRWGRWDAEWHSTFTSRFDYDQKDGRGTQNALGLISHVFDVVPRFRSSLVVSDTLGPLNVTAATTYVASVDNTLDSNRRVDPYVRTNLTLTYDLAPGTQLWLSVHDLFDAGVPYVGLLRTQGLASDFTYVDYIGQFWTLGLRTRF